MKLKQMTLPLALLLIVASLVGCGATVAPAATSAHAAYTDPFAYCATVGTIDAPDASYTGPQVPESVAQGLKGEQICWAAAMWALDESANCPQDQPISACEVTPEQQNYTVTLNCGVASAEGEIGAEVGSAELVFDSTRGGVYRDLYVMNREGFPAWSPDGTYIAFTSRRNGNNEIYVMKADGTNPTRWTDNPADDFAPAWSPDGTQIAFISDRGREAGAYDLYLMDVVSTAVTRLTDDEAIDYSPRGRQMGRGSPSVRTTTSRPTSMSSTSTVPA